MLAKERRGKRRQTIHKHAHAYTHIGTPNIHCVDAHGLENIFRGEGIIKALSAASNNIIVVSCRKAQRRHHLIIGMHGYAQLGTYLALTMECRSQNDGKKRAKKKKRRCTFVEWRVLTIVVQIRKQRIHRPKRGHACSGFGRQAQSSGEPKVRMSSTLHDKVLTVG